MAGTEKLGIFRQNTAAMYFSIFDTYNTSKEERRHRHLTVVLLAIAVSWALWCVVSIPYYKDFSGLALLGEVGVDLAEHIVETTVLIELSLLFCAAVVRIFWKQEKSFIRMLMMVLIVALFNILCAYGVAAFYRAVYPENTTVFWRVFYTDSAMTSVLSTTCLISFLISRHHDEEEAKTQAEMQAKEEELAALQSRLDSLALQADNHFVFNSFSTLYNLIPEEAEDARTFTLNLSNIYRYLMMNASTHIVPLQKELAFTKEYLNLIGYRYSGVSAEIAGDLETENAYVVPVSVQMMVENALKHNRHGEGAGLHIRIYKEADWIIVENNILPRLDTPEKSGRGLENLGSRYELLSGKKLTIENDGKTFRVGLPLLDVNGIRYESSDN